MKILQIPIVIIILQKSEPRNGSNRVVILLLLFFLLSTFGSSSENPMLFWTSTTRCFTFKIIVDTRERMSFDRKSRASTFVSRSRDSISVNSSSGSLYIAYDNHTVEIDLRSYSNHRVREKHQMCHSQLTEKTVSSSEERYWNDQRESEYISDKVFMTDMESLFHRSMSLSITRRAIRPNLRPTLQEQSVLVVYDDIEVTNLSLNWYESPWRDRNKDLFAKLCLIDGVVTYSFSKDEKTESIATKIFVQFVNLRSLSTCQDMFRDFDESHVFRFTRRVTNGRYKSEGLCDPVSFKYLSCWHD